MEQPRLNLTRPVTVIRPTERSRSLANATGGSNTANGSQALVNNTTGNQNMANGFQALLSNTVGDSNAATGNNALVSNTEGDFNTATGDSALHNNTTGSSNTVSALPGNTTGNNKTAAGFMRLPAIPLVTTVFTVLFCGVRIFGRKTAQFCDTQREY